jgi:hypothetical protein
MCVCVFLCCVVLCGRGLASGWSSVQGVLPKCLYMYIVKPIRVGQRSEKDCKCLFNKKNIVYNLTQSPHSCTYWPLKLILSRKDSCKFALWFLHNHVILKLQQCVG